MAISTNNRYRSCVDCDHYNEERQYCEYFKRKLSPHCYCLVDGNMVYFLKNNN